MTQGYVVNLFLCNQFPIFFFNFGQQTLLEAYNIAAVYREATSGINDY